MGQSANVVHYIVATVVMQHTIYRTEHWIALICQLTGQQVIVGYECHKLFIGLVVDCPLATSCLLVDSNCGQGRLGPRSIFTTRANKLLLARIAK